MAEQVPTRRRLLYFAALFGLLLVIFLDVEMYRWFRRTHDPAELLTCVGIAGSATGAYFGLVSPRGRSKPISSALAGTVVGLNVGWLLLLAGGVRELFRLGVL